MGQQQDAGRLELLDLEGDVVRGGHGICTTWGHEVGEVDLDMNLDVAIGIGTGRGTGVGIGMGIHTVRTQNYSLKGGSKGILGG